MAIKKHVVLLFILFALNSYILTYAQLPDQNEAKVENLNPDSLWKTIREIYRINPDSARPYSDQLLEVASKTQNTLAMARAYWVKGRVDDKGGYIGKALVNYMKSIKYYEEIDYHKEVAAGMANIGNLFIRADDNQNALKYYQGALKRYTDVNNDKGIHKTWYNLGECFEAMEDYVRSLQYFDKVLGSSNDQKLKNKSLNFKGIIHFKQDKFSKARTYYQHSLVMAKSLNNGANIAIAYNNIGETFLSETLTDSAYYYLDQAILLKDSIGNPDFTLSTITLLAKANQMDGLPEKGLELLKDGIVAARSDIINHNLLDALNFVQVLYEEIGEVDKNLLQYYTLQQQQIDLLKQTNHEFDVQSKQYAIKLSVNKLNAETSFEGLKSTQRAIISISITTVFVIFIGLLIYFRQRKINLRKKLFRSIDNLQEVVEDNPT